MNKIRLVILGGASLLIAACATTPLTPFPSTHPASPEAQEAPVRPFQNRLMPDEATKKSNALLSGAEKSAASESSNQKEDMSNMPGMKMDGTKDAPKTPPTKDSGAMKEMPGMDMGGSK